MDKYLKPKITFDHKIHSKGKTPYMSFKVENITCDTFSEMRNLITFNKLDISIQGSAADICKLAMLSVEEVLQRHPELNCRFAIQTLIYLDFYKYFFVFYLQCFAKSMKTNTKNYNFFFRPVKMQLIFFILSLSNNFLLTQHYDTNISFFIRSYIIMYIFLS